MADVETNHSDEIPRLLNEEIMFKFDQSP